jgi:hypothetical protein
MIENVISLVHLYFRGRRTPDPSPLRRSTVAGPPVPEGMIESVISSFKLSMMNVSACEQAGVARRLGR